MVIQGPQADINMYAEFLQAIIQIMSGVSSTMVYILEAAALNAPGENMDAFKKKERVSELNRKIAHLPCKVNNTFLVPQRDFYMNKVIIMRKPQKR